MNLVEPDLKVLDVMTLKPVIASSDMSIRDVAALMDKYGVGSVVIKDDHDVVGIVTEPDFVRRAILEGMDFTNEPIKSIMTRDLITVSPGTDVADALNVMKDADVRHLPVLDDGKMVGFVTLKDILRVQPHLFDSWADVIRLREEHRKPIGGNPAILDEDFLDE